MCLFFKLYYKIFHKIASHVNLKIKIYQKKEKCFCTYQTKIIVKKNKQACGEKYP